MKEKYDAKTSNTTSIPIENIDKKNLTQPNNLGITITILFQGTILENIQSFTNNYKIETIERNRKTKQDYTK